MFRVCDLVRVDHFRAFAAYWRVDGAALNAIDGSWQPAPGTELFEAVTAAIGPRAIVAEDLGTITPDVDALRDQFRFPGMRVLHFAFASDWDNAYLPHNYDTSNTVVYTGTHDNDTTVGWFGALSTEERRNVLRYLARDGGDIAFDMIRLAFGSVADTAIVPVQDFLALGSDARMNTPGRATGNWTWRVEATALDAALMERIADLTYLYRRKLTETA
jgi:4-alpha-glucanotransferase